MGQFLLECLYQSGAKHIYGVPGDAITGIRNELNTFGKIDHFMCADEETAGWSAEVYGRIQNVGAVYFTYNAGANKVLGPTDEGILHSSALILIGGEPSMEFRNGNYGILHHHQTRLNKFDDQRQLFAVKLTDRRTKSITNLKTAARNIATMIGKAASDRLPVYIGMPADMWDKEISYTNEDVILSYGHIPMVPQQKEWVDVEILPIMQRILSEMTHPLLFTGHALASFGLLKETVAFAEKLNLPVVAAFNGYGGFPPDHPLFLGTYDGPASVPPDVRKITEHSDLIVVGLLDTDLNYALQLKTVKLPEAKIVIDPIRGEVTDEWLWQCNAKAQAYLLKRLTEMSNFCFEQTKAPLSSWVHDRDTQWIVSQKKSDGNDPITVADIAPIVGRFLADKDMPLVFDVGDPMLIALGILPGLTQITYTSNFAAMGVFTGCIGLEHATGKRPLVLVGDGAFAMGEVYSFSLTETRPIIVILNNRGWSMMRQFGGENKETEKGKGADSLMWKPLDFHPDCRVETPREFEHALFRAFRRDEPFIIEVMLDPDDKSESLRNFKDMQR